MFETHDIECGSQFGVWYSFFQMHQCKWGMPLNGKLQRSFWRALCWVSVSNISCFITAENWVLKTSAKRYKSQFLTETKVNDWRRSFQIIDLTVETQKQSEIEDPVFAFHGWESVHIFRALRLWMIFLNLQRSLWTSASFNWVTTETKACNNKFIMP